MTAPDIAEAIGVESRQALDNARIAVKEGFITRIQDVTGVPAYKITDAGRARLAQGPESQRGKRLKSAAANLASRQPTEAAPEPGSDTACCNAAKVMGRTAQEMLTEKDAEVASLRDRLESLTNAHIDFCEWLGKTTDGAVPLNMAECKSLVETAVYRAEFQRDAWREVAAKYECDTPTELAELLAGYRDAAESKLADLKAHSDMLGQIAAIVADYLPEGAYTTYEGVVMMDQLISAQHSELVNACLAARLFDESVKLAEKKAAGYLIRMPKKPPVIRASHETARALALSGARAAGKAEVFALVPVGRVVRGTEWKEAVNG